VDRGKDIYVHIPAHSRTKSIGELLPNFGAARLILSRSSNDYASRHAITMGLLGVSNAIDSEVRV